MTLAERVELLEKKLAKIIKFLKANKEGILTSQELVDLHAGKNPDEKIDWEHLVCMAVNNKKEGELEV